MSDFVYEIFVEKAKIATVAKGELINNVPDLIGEVNPGQIINFFSRKMRVVEKTVRVNELIIELYLKQISESMTYGILRENLENIVLGYRKGGTGI